MHIGVLWETVLTQELNINFILILKNSKKRAIPLQAFFMVKTLFSQNLDCLISTLAA
jgi:hypothetical protein